MHPIGGQAAVLLAILGTALCLSSPRVCQTPECLALSAQITSNMNLSADPCEDFNEFACGNFAANTPYDPATLSWSRDSEPLAMQYGLDAVSNKLTKRMFEMLFLQRTVSGEDADVNVMYRLASDLFRSCATWLKSRTSKRRSSSPGDDFFLSIDFFAGVLNHLVQSFPPVTQKDWFERALAKMFSFVAMADDWRRGLIEIHATQRLLNARRKSDSADNITRVRIDKGYWRPHISNYSKYLEFFSQLSAARKLLFNNASEFVSIANVIQYNASSSSSVTNNKGCNVSGVYTGRYSFDVTVRELDRLSACIDSKNPFSWAAFLDVVFDGVVSQETAIETGSQEDAIRLAEFVSFLKKRSLGASASGKFTSHFSFLVFDWLLVFAEFLPANLLRQLRKDEIMYRPKVRIGNEEPTSDCMQFTKVLLGPVVERMFHKWYHDVALIDHVRSMADLIQNATIANVRNEKWITESSKSAIADKIVQLERVIGFDVISVANLKKMYASTIRSYKPGNFSSSYENFGTFASIAMSAFAGRKGLLLSSHSVSELSIFGDALTVNAFNTMTGNQIVFPMGILSPFMYHRSYPDYMNLGGIGVVIGHEIGHGFDETGHELRTNGAMGHFWDNATEDGFLQRVSCVMNRYGSYQLVPGMPHNSNTTVGNDISDLMGIRSAFRALQLLGEGGRSLRLPNLPDSLTPEKLFFVQAAQPWCSKSEPSALVSVFESASHSPPHIRIRGMMENSRDFAEVFKCKRGQAMNPRDKCQFW